MVQLNWAEREGEILQEDTAGAVPHAWSGTAEDRGMQVSLTYI